MLLVSVYSPQPSFFVPGLLRRANLSAAQAVAAGITAQLDLQPSRSFTSPEPLCLANMSVRPPEVRVLKQQVATHHRKSGQLHQQSDLTFKIAVVGPSRSGKTRLANQMASTPFLSADIAGHSYSETAAVRIQSFGVNVLAATRSAASGASSQQLLPLGVECELWDVSGSSQYEQLWPAVCSDLSGVIVVYEAKNTVHQSELKAWLEWFTHEAKLSTGQLLAFAHGGSGSAPKPLKVTVKEEVAGGEVRERVVSVPVVNVPMGGGMVNGSNGGGEGESGVRAARLELEQWLGGSVFAFHPKAAETIETMAK